MSKKVFLYRAGAFGDQVHCSNVIRAFYEEGWEVSFLYNFKGAQIHTYNPMIKNHHFFEASAKDATPEVKKAHIEKMNRLREEHDRFVTFQQSLEGAIIYPEDSPQYFWPHWMRREKSENICFYDASMKWAGLTHPKYMGWTGDVYFTKEENNFVLDYLEQFRDKFIILWALRGSMYQKAMYPIAEEICTEFHKMHPETVILTTGDHFCKQFEWEHPAVKNLSGRIPYRQALCMSQYVDLVVTPETGLGIGAGAFSTPKIMLLTAASLTNIVGNDENDYSLQSDAWCSPCFRAIYNTYNCPVLDETKMVESRPVDECSLEYGKTIKMPLPICINFPKETVLGRMEEVYQAKHERIWIKHESEEPRAFKRPNQK